MTSDQQPAGSSSMPYTPGSVLLGKYRVERLLGEGGMGWVVLATHLHLDQRVALKFMHKAQATGSPEGVARFLREARAAARIQSEHVARVSDVGTLEDGAPYLVMEYLEGQDLDSLLRDRHSLPVDLAIDYAMQACEGLAEAHAAGIIHRDLKPANLFLARRSDGSVRVKLLDFGISKMTPAGGSSDGGMTNTQALMGSPLYMAPEQMRSTKNVDRRADIWSMGVIVYEMLAGTSPFGGETLPEICARILAEPPTPLRSGKLSVSPSLEAVVLRCLEKEASARYPDVAALAQALARFGAQDAQASADRIGRVLGARASNVPAPRPSAGGASVAAVAAVSSIASKTSASFGTASATSAGRRARLLPLALAGGGAALAAALVIVVVATRGKGGPAPAAPSAAAVVTAAQSATEPEPPTTLAPATPPPPPPATPIPLATAPPRSPASHHAPSPKPTTAKPAGTNGFGGRD
jgi:serine/threonine-protein kinase